jgi:hypothetical protein
MTSTSAITMMIAATTAPVDFNALMSTFQPGLAGNYPRRGGNTASAGA